ncbi:MAG TPA: hypothetical protein VNU70_03835 [Puia sp.]|jgi:hypothetical protein|nr:hypothetical protein [Puia sp.]
MKSLIHAVFGRLITGIFFTLTLATAHAQRVIPGDGQHESAATVKYLGTEEDMIVFNVSYPNPEGNKFQVTIKDQDGSIIYRDYFSERSFYRQFRLPKADKDRIVFIFHQNEAADVVKTFEINVNSRYVREVAIRKL